MISTGFRYQVRRIQQTLERAGVTPPALQLVPGHLSGLDVGIVHVSDFQFAAPRGFQSANNLKHAPVVKVDSNYRIFRLWLRRLLFDLQNARALELRHSEALRIGNSFQKNFRAFSLSSIGVNGRANIALDDVVAEHDTNRSRAGEMLDQ